MDAILATKMDQSKRILFVNPVGFLWYCKCRILMIAKREKDSSENKSPSECFGALFIQKNRQDFLFFPSICNLMKVNKSEKIIYSAMWNQLKGPPHKTLH